MAIRLATERDRDALFPLAKALAISAVVQREAFNATFDRVLRFPDSCLAVAEEGGRVVGYLFGSLRPTFHSNGRVGWVEELMVEEAARKQGKGRLLMAWFEGWARKQSCAYVSLASRRAGGFYRRLGYKAHALYFKKVL